MPLRTGIAATASLGPLLPRDFFASAITTTCTPTLTRSG
jgi:hypothetical protein